MLLADLSIGEKGVIISLSESKGTDKLLEMGILPNSTFELVRKAPFGGPIAVLIEGHLIGMRMEDAQLVSVRKRESSIRSLETK